MQKFISYEKLSKKNKKEHDKRKRASWGELNPITRKVESKKVYNRKRTAMRDYDTYGGFAFAV